MPSINWYPGHMAKSRRMLLEQLRAVDAVIELVDARAPLATRNPDLLSLTRSKARLVILNKADLADDQQTSRWLEYFRRRGSEAMRFNSNGGRVKEMLGRIEQATRPVAQRYLQKGVKKTIRVMVLGIPNVGKSTFINRINGATIAKTSDRPGVTRAKHGSKSAPIWKCWILRACCRPVWTIRTALGFWPIWVPFAIRFSIPKIWPPGFFLA